jgi:hypothetical protein
MHIEPKNASHLRKKLCMTKFEREMAEKIKGRLQYVLASFADGLELGEDVLIRVKIGKEGHIRTKIVSYPHTDSKRDRDKFWTQLSSPKNLTKWKFEGCFVSNPEE